MRIRTIRRETLDAAKKMKSAGTATEDDLKKFEKEVQNLTDKFIAQINKNLEAKEADLKQI